MDDADVRERGLGQDERHVTSSEFPLERIDVVELDDACRHRRIDRRPEVALRARTTPSAPRVANVSSTVPW